MSQSSAHQQLVIATAAAIRHRHPNLLIEVDLQDAPGDPIPPLIGSFRPDIIARSHTASPDIFIAEAKTDGDIDNTHTSDQIAAYLDHLEAQQTGTGTFILAVHGQVACIARNVLRFSCGERVSPRLHVYLFDGLDFWKLGSKGEALWHLS